MHASTLTKVDFFCHVILLEQQGRLRASADTLGVRIDRLLESRSAKTVALVAGVVGAVVAIYHAILWLTRMDAAPTPKPLSYRPTAPLAGRITVPGGKSISHRADVRRAGDG